jgi:hypothetical protein
MITCKSKEGVFDMLFVPLFAQPGSHQPDMSATQHKIYFINRKERDEIQYHHGLGEGLFYDNPATSESFLAYGKNVGQAIPFLFRLAINTKTLVIDCHCKSSPRMQIFGKGYSSSFFLCI